MSRSKKWRIPIYLKATVKIGGMHLQLSCMNSDFPGLSQTLLSCLCFLQLMHITPLCSAERKNSLNFGITEGKMEHQELAETEFCSG